MVLMCILLLQVVIQLKLMNKAMDQMAVEITNIWWVTDSINNLLQRKCNDVSDLLIQGSELIHVVKDLKMNLQILVDPKICLLEEEMGLLPSHNAGSSTGNDTSP